MRPIPIAYATYTIPTKIRPIFTVKTIINTATSVYFPLAMTTTSTSDTQTPFLEPLRAAILLILVPFVLLLVFPIPSSKVLSSITTFVSPFSLLTGIWPSLVVAITSTGHNIRELLNSAKIYTNKIKHTSPNNTPIFELAKL